MSSSYDFHKIIKKGAALRRASRVFIIYAAGCACFSSFAYADDSVALQMNLPSQISKSATTGLISAVATAGPVLVAVGERGRILRSTDNGRSWLQVSAPTSVTLTDVAFSDENNGWATGQMGVILHTADGGLTWIKQFDGIQAGNAMLEAAKADITNMGTNSATTANLQAAQQMVAGGPNVPFFTILPLSSVSALVMGGFGLAFSTQDAGKTWQSLADVVPNPNGFHIYGLAQEAADIFAVGESGFMLRGRPGGTYTALTSPFQGTLFGILAAQDGSLIAYGLEGTILVSSDQGKSWKQPLSGSGSIIDCGVVLKNGDILLGDVAGDLILSKDNGTSFLTTSVPEPVVGLVEAADGSIVIAGPLGLKTITHDALFKGI